MMASAAHHGVGDSPRPRAYGPRASTDTRGGSPSRGGPPGMPLKQPFKGMTMGYLGMI